MRHMFPKPLAFNDFSCAGVNYSNLLALLLVLSFEDGVISLPYFLVAKSTSFFMLCFLIL